MRKFGTFDIPFTGLKLGTHRFQFDIEKTFFDQFEFSEIDEAQFHIDIDLEKQSTMIILHFDISGNVEVVCDRCGDTMMHPASFKDRIIVKFGNEEEEESEEIMLIPHHEHKINVAELIYEFAQLSLPARRIHPDGECNEEAINKLSDLSYDSSEKNDPRWEGLKEIKKD